MNDGQPRSEPEWSRPRLRGYGIPDDLSGLLSWSEVSEQLAEART